MAKGALRPEYYDDIRHLWKVDQQKAAEKAGVDIEDQQLHAIAAMAGWGIIKTHIQNLKDGLDLKLKEAIANGMSESDIGKRTIMIDLVKDCLDSLVSKVEDSALIVEEVAHGTPEE